MKKPYTVLLAAFNEADTIIECLNDLYAACGDDAELILLHGGSDQTLERAREWHNSHPDAHLKAIRHFGDCGKGHAIKTGISLASHPVIIQFDTDMQFNPFDVPRIAAPLLDDRADLVIGSRFMKGADRSGHRFGLLRDTGNLLLNAWISLLTGRHLSDITTGAKGWQRDLIWAVPFQDNRFVYEMEIVMRSALHGARLLQVPVDYTCRTRGESGHGTGWRETWSIIQTGLLIAWRALGLRLTLQRHPTQEANPPDETA
jgi:glycosyltransferase involved in cell wall biosynthesis